MTLPKAEVLLIYETRHGSPVLDLERLDIFTFQILDIPMA